MKKSKAITEEQRLTEVNRRGEVIREVTKVIQNVVHETVRNILTSYPEHNKIIRDALTGEAQRLLAEYEEIKRKESWARAVKADAKAKKKKEEEEAAKKKAASN